MIEYEIRKLEVDTEELEAKLKDLGAEYSANKKFRRHVFDVIPKNENTWVRLRTDGKKTTLTVKEIVSDSVDGTYEWETKVDDFDTVLELLEKMGLKSRGYQENKRIEYVLDGVEVCIDEWPEIPPYVEFEGDSEDHVMSVVRKMGYKKEDMTTLNTQDIYSNYGIDLNKKPILKF